MLFGLIWIAAAVGENLLVNPGFEELEAGQPVGWRVFVAPQEGAHGVLDETTAHSGNVSAKLHTPFPYPQDPANNWSQNVERPLAGKHLEASAYIKVRSATEADLWVQCWRRQPLSLLQTFSTGIDTPITGTADWQQASVAFTVPEQTSFITVRCVLKGAGTAWFDDVVLRETAAPEETPAEEAAPPAAPAPETPSAPPAAAPPPVDLGPLERQISALRDTNQALSETIGGLRENNQALSEELRQLREELEGLRAQIDMEPEPEVEPPGPVPPLVPHGEDPEQYR